MAELCPATFRIPFSITHCYLSCAAAATAVGIESGFIRITQIDVVERVQYRVMAARSVLRHDGQQLQEVALHVVAVRVDGAFLKVARRIGSFVTSEGQGVQKANAQETGDDQQTLNRLPRHSRQQQSLRTTPPSCVTPIKVLSSSKLSYPPFSHYTLHIVAQQSVTKGKRPAARQTANDRARAVPDMERKTYNTSWHKIEYLF